MGWRDAYELTPPCSVPFFDGLHALICVLKGTYGKRLRKVLAENPRFAALLHMNCEWKRLELMSIEDRLIVLLTAFWMLDDWPRRFVHACEEAHLTRSLLAERVDVLPFWFVEAANNYLDGRTYHPTIKEIESAKRLLSSNGYLACKQNLEYILDIGRDFLRLHRQDRVYKLGRRKKSVL